MRRFVFLFAMAVAWTSSDARASNAGLDLNVNVGNRPRGVVAVPVSQVYIEEPPVFLRPRSLDFYVALGIPYDLFYVANNYYLHQGNRWYRSAYYNGPWVVVSYRGLPHKLRKHKLDRIRVIREEEYIRFYEDDGDSYRRRYFYPQRHHHDDYDYDDKYYDDDDE